MRRLVALSVLCTLFMSGVAFVNNEGAVVWVLEYLRYHLNNCNHGDAATTVLQQIRGLGIQPTSTA